MLFLKCSRSRAGCSIRTPRRRNPGIPQGRQLLLHASHIHVGRRTETGEKPAKHGRQCHDTDLREIHSRVLQPDNGRSFSAAIGARKDRQVLSDNNPNCTHRKFHTNFRMHWLIGGQLFDGHPPIFSFQAVRNHIRLPQRLFNKTTLLGSFDQFQLRIGRIIAVDQDVEVKRFGRRFIHPV